MMADSKNQLMEAYKRTQLLKTIFRAKVLEHLKDTIRDFSRPSIDPESHLIVEDSKAT